MLPGSTVGQSWAGEHIGCTAHVLAMVAPEARLLLAPLLKIRETVPEVVGVQFRVKGSPAVAERPALGMLKGFW